MPQILRIIDLYAHPTTPSSPYHPNEPMDTTQLVMTEVRPKSRNPTSGGGPYEAQMGFITLL